MTIFTVPGKDQVSPESALIFEKVQRSIGKLPNLYAVIGYSAIALKALLTLQETLSHGIFTPKEREAVDLAVSEANGCDYCLAAHTATALRKGFTLEDTLDLRKGNSNDAKLGVIASLARSIAMNRGQADQSLVDDFFAAGFTNGALMELIGLVTAMTFTNYVYALTGIPIDYPAAQPIK
jgi:AhpD family alkylhydroperoxidase